MNPAGYKLPVALVGLGLMLGFALVWFMPAPPSVDVGIEWFDTPIAISKFKLASESGDFTDRDLQQGWQLLNFGFLSCPDVCPTNLAEIGRLMDRLDGGSLGVVFVSIDPDRDSRAALADYTSYFHSSFIGVTGDPANLHALADAVGVRFSISSDGNEVTHSDWSPLIDPNGFMRGRLRPGFNVQAVAQALNRQLGAAE